uniref:Uncharacterized protein n=1 Tax=Glossina pallidipes TaxID=7398 RepID=A0A1A9ZSN6_GLOPL
MVIGIYDILKAFFDLVKAIDIFYYLPVVELPLLSVLMVVTTFPAFVAVSSNLFPRYQLQLDEIFPLFRILLKFQSDVVPVALWLLDDEPVGRLWDYVAVADAAAELVYAVFVFVHDVDVGIEIEIAAVADVDGVAGRLTSNLELPAVQLFVRKTAKLPAEH